MVGVERALGELLLKDYDDVLGHTVGEIFLLGITGHVVEGQNGDGGLGGER